MKHENLFYKNKGANTTRNLDIIDGLFNDISEGIYKVFGPDYYGFIYSGGQPKRGSGVRRVGTVRHDDGFAADVYIYDKLGVKVVGADLAPLAQYWLASKNGSVGLEMYRGGIHLDAWKTPPTKRGALFWNYKKKAEKKGGWLQDQKEFDIQQKAIQDGLKGIFPKLYKEPSFWGAVFKIVSAFLPKKKD